MKLDSTRRVWVEDESLAIGKIFLPNDFWASMEKSPLVQMDVDKGTRVKRLVSEYGPADREEFLQIMVKIVKKLGGQNFKDAKEKLLSGDMSATIEILLTYYDKAYTESISRRKDRIRHTIPWDGKRTADAAAALLTLGLSPGKQS
jgi:tRNA 2-selenouridine synthase